MKYSVQCANGFFRKLRSYGVWIPAPDKLVIAGLGQDLAEACKHVSWNFLVRYCLGAGSLHVVYNIWANTYQDGYTKLAGLAHQRQWRLFYLRPKLHQFMHLVLNLSLPPHGPCINPISLQACSVLFVDSCFGPL